MKRYAMNSIALVIMSALFVLPFTGFAFIRYEPIKGNNQRLIARTLGASTVKKDTSFEVVRSINVDVYVNDQVQIYYDVVPGEYIGEAFEYVVFVGDDTLNRGLVVNLDEKSDRIDLKTFYNQASLPDNPVKVKILVLEF